MEDKISEYLYKQYITFDEANEKLKCLGFNDGDASWFDVFNDADYDNGILSIPNEQLDVPNSWKDIVPLLKSGEIYYVYPSHDLKDDPCFVIARVYDDENKEYYMMIDCWCDYTGVTCQSDMHCTCASTMNSLVKYALTETMRSHILEKIDK